MYFQILMKMWNYRLMIREYPFRHDVETCIEMHEVYYDEDGKPNGYTKDPVAFSLIIDHTDNLEEDMLQLKNNYCKALEKPILWYGDKFPQEYEFPKKMKQQ
jgi:hypothetical protein